MKRIAALLLAASALPAFAAPTPAERAAVAAVDAGMPANLALLERLVNQNSGTMNLVGVERVGTMMRAELEPLGFKAVWTPLPQTKRAGHLVATRAGKPGSKRLLLIGHLDTVFEADSPFQRYRRNGDKAEGPGVGDDKGGMVVMLAALKAMKAAGTLDDATFEIVLTGDEERTGDPVSIARAGLIAAGKRADAALDFEGLVRQDGRDMGSVARRSSNSWQLTTTGTTGHSSLIFDAAHGDGAINELARILAAFRKELPEPNLTFNTGLVVGGATASFDTDAVRGQATGKPNIIPATAIARGDFRTLSEEQTARVRAKMEAIVAAHAPGTSARILFDEGYPSMAPTAGNRALLAALNGVNRDLGLPQMPELDPLKRGAGDIAFVARDVDGLAGLGPYSTGDHAPGETVDIPSIAVQAKRAALLMARLGQGKP
ncbi:M20/M25/M40 family metallo-hydrolase [Sphingomonas prati]|uniref:Glutamate carboxypeptidase n=1 Tax=Sphingomonas prati TaxID=1843237 RepID=A0A7W9BQG4_9SPHN|nr:M20/M25/M40 family metallo-hydrolase [Sphingomonas prati]MBB5728217.1 glutamate carboxypeptidase [Sphingomonas prati]GGE75493.1 peptidase M20 [Sphingomonas prati]